MKRGRNPRLVTRFAVGSLVAFVAIGAALSVVVSGQLRARQEQAAQYHAEFVANSILLFELRGQDLVTPMTPSTPRYDGLLGFVRARILQPPVVRVKIWRADGTVVFSDEPRLLGLNFGIDTDLRSAFGGTAVSEVSSLTDPENLFERGRFPKLLATYVPLFLHGDQPGDRPSAVVEIYSDYAGIQSQVEHLFRTLVTTLTLGLFALYVLLLPIIRRAGRTLSAQNAQLERQAERLRGLLQTEQVRVAELEELNRLKDGFVAVASHEVRTPLTSILGYTKTLRRPEFADDVAAREEFLEAIERQGDRLNRLVENLLASSHIEDGNGRLSLAPESFASVADEVVTGLGPKGRRVRVAIPDGLPPVVTDRRRLELVLTNLLDNATKFSPTGTDCELGARAEGDGLVFWVRDQGIGIAPDQQARIFERFYQIDSSDTRHYGGVGLGLNLVKELVESLGGSVSVDSEPAQGTTFCVTLPRLTPSEGNGGRMLGAPGESSPVPEVATAETVRDRARTREAGS